MRENPRGIAHIPGFWIDENGEANLWQNRDHTKPLLIIPYRNPAGKIQACQVRFTSTLNQNKKRYLWLSLPKMNSSGSGTPLHFASWKILENSNSEKPLLITEGALKADVTARFLPRFYALACSGIGCSHDLIVNISRGKSLFLAFDNDYQDNPAVLRQLIRLLQLRFADNQTSNLQFPTKILHWDIKYKGIDDALLNSSQILELTIPQWISLLSDTFRTSILKDFVSFL